MKHRESNFEILRIIAMVMIIGCHYAIHGIQHGGISALSYGVWSRGDFVHRLVTCVFLPGGDVGVALFFLLTGYFKIESNNNSIKLVFLETVYYGIFTAVLFCIIKIMNIPLVDINNNAALIYSVRSILSPITSGNWWFVTIYCAVVIISPLTNKFLKKLNKKQFMLLLVMYGIFGYMLASSLAEFYNFQRGLYYYIVGAFLRTYKIQSKNKHLFLFSIILWFFSVFLFYIIDVCIIKEYNPIFVMLLRCVNVGFPIFGCAVCIFKLLEGFSLKNDIVNKIAKTTFGIYLIHDSKIVRAIIWNTIFKVDSVQYVSDFYFLYALLTIIVIFVLGLFLDFFRVYFVEKKYIQLFDNICLTIKRYGN